MRKSRINETVWILGAGFSRFLGAPLMNGLLEHRPMDELSILTRDMDLVPKGPELKDMEWTTLAFRSWSRLDDKRTAEQFIEQIVIANAATRDGSDRIPKAAAYAKMFDLWVQHAHQSDFRVGLEMAKDDHIQIAHLMQRMYNAVMRLVVLNTTTFVRELNEEEERVLPYLFWSRQLTHGDSVVSFNYDGVLDLLQEWNGRIRVLTEALGSAQEGEDWQSWLDNAVDNDCAIALPMHGSLAWSCPAGSSLSTWLARPSLANPEHFPIGLPGPDKAKVSRRRQSMWNLAQTLLSHARRVIFVGYSCPTTDMHALSMIQRSLATNSRLRDIHLVLGQDDWTKNRLTRILDLTTPGTIPRSSTRVKDSNLLAEEYLLCYNAGEDRLSTGG